MAVLPDISVLLPLIYGAHVHHGAAAAWLNTVEQAGELVLCRVSQLGILRLLGQPAVMGPDVKNGAEAWKTWDALLADGRFRFEGEPEGFEEKFRDLGRSFAQQPGRWQDAYLAAFAIAGDLELVTFDAGFRSFAGLRHHVLPPGRPSG